MNGKESFTQVFLPNITSKTTYKKVYKNADHFPHHEATKRMNPTKRFRAESKDNAICGRVEVEIVLWYMGSIMCQMSVIQMSEEY
jgi:hypothetical protein